MIRVLKSGVTAGLMMNVKSGILKRAQDLPGGQA